MVKTQNEGIYQTGLTRVIVHLKDGGVLDLNNVDTVQTIRDETGQLWFEVLYNSKSYFDTFGIPIENLLYYKTAYSKI